MSAQNRVLCFEPGRGQCRQRISEIAVLDTNAFKGFFEFSIGRTPAIMMLSDLYRLYVAPRVEEELKTFKAPWGFLNLMKNRGLMGTAWDFGNSIAKCRILVAKDFARMGKLDPGERDALALCLLLSRAQGYPVLFTSNDAEAISQARKFFARHYVGRAMSCQELLNEVYLRYTISREFRTRLQTYGLHPNNALSSFLRAQEHLTTYVSKGAEIQLYQMCSVEYHHRCMTCLGNC